MPTQKPTPTPTAQPINVDVLASHYQKTFEVAFEYWKERNRLFVILVLTAGVGLLLLLRVPTADSLLVAAIAKFLNITDQAVKTDLLEKFPFNILLSGFLVTIFYLMQRLYSTNLSVMRTFLYLGALEDEVRKYLGLPKGSISFTREGSFYWGKRSSMQAASKVYYIVVLFIILIPFIVFKLIADFQSQNWLVIVIDLIVSIMAVLYWGEYARSSFRLDVPKLEPSETDTTAAAPESNQDTKSTPKKKSA